MRPILAIALLSAVTVCTGCTAYRDIGTAENLYNAAPVCCGSLDALTYSPIKIGITDISLDEKNEAFVFQQSGKSYFKAFSIPKSNVPIQVVAHSAIFQNGYPSKGIAIFFPKIMLLDQDKKTIASIDWVDDKILHVPVGSNVTAYVETFVDLSAYPSARYMVIYTDGTRVGLMQDDLQYIYNPSLIAGGGAVPYVANVVAQKELGGTVPFPATRSPIAPGSLSVEISAKK